MSAENELQELRERVASLEAQQLRGRRSRRVLVTAVVFAAFGVMAADGNCPNGLPACFAANTAARAADVNHNFSQLKEWIERKTGPVTTTALTTDGGVTITAGDLNAPRLKTSAAGVTFHNGANQVAAVDTAGNASFNSVRVNGSDGGVNLPRNCTVRQVTANSGNLLAASCLAAEFVVGGGGDCGHNSLLNHSGPIDLANGRASGWAIDCQQPGQFTISAGVVTSVSAICCQF